MSGWWSPIAYVAIDLFPLLVLVAAGIAVLQVDTATGGVLRARWRRFVAWTGDAAPLYGEVAIAAAAIAVVVLSTPALRFSNVIVGDEPKYLRFCELWLQGRGMNLEGVQDRSALPPGEPTHFLQSIAAAGPALRADLTSLATDARRLARGRGWTRRYNQSKYAGHLNITGRNGGFYQWHSAGISAVILPAYALDLWLFDTRTGRFADDLFCVNLAFLGMFALVAVASWRLARTASPPAIAAAAALGVALSLPIGAYAFQFYPEMGGAVLVLLLVLDLLGGRALTSGRAAALGAALGALAWMHIRYVPMEVVGFCVLVWTYRHQRGPLAVAIAVLTVFTALLCLYAYHVTGSILPSAFYQSENGPVQFSWRRLPWGTVTEFFDRDFGLLAIAPVYLLAFPGLGLMLRRTPRAAAIVIAFGLALFLPTGGHGVEVAGTTPGRFEMTVLPLAALPIAAWLRAVRARPALVAAAVLLIVVSVANGIAHDLVNRKTMVLMEAAGRSGWNPSLLFPQVNPLRWMPTSFDRVALRVWIGACAAAAVWGFATTMDRDAARPIRPAGAALLAFGSAAALAAAGLVAIAAGGPSRDARFTVTRIAPGASPATQAIAGFPR